MRNYGRREDRERRKPSAKYEIFNLLLLSLPQLDSRLIVLGLAWSCGWVIIAVGGGVLFVCWSGVDWVVHWRGVVWVIRGVDWFVHWRGVVWVVGGSGARFLISRVVSGVVRGGSGTRFLISRVVSGVVSGRRCVSGVTGGVASWWVDWRAVFRVVGVVCGIHWVVCAGGVLWLIVVCAVGIRWVDVV